MQKIKFEFRIAFTVAAVVSILFSSCKREMVDPPPVGEPNIVANTTIADLKARYQVIGTTVTIHDDVVISGIVNASDRSGNYYQQITIQDETGGILLRLAGGNLHTSYPVGRRVWVKCKGLVLGDFARMIQLGGGTDSTGNATTMLSARLQDEHIIRGALNQHIEPKVVTIGQLTTGMHDPHIATLIRLQNHEIAPTDTGKNYAEATTSGNRFVQSCISPTSNRITLRTSNFANFAIVRVPSGNGEIDGIYSIFTTTKQLIIRDTNDVRLWGPRCTGGGVGGTGPIGSTTISLGTSPVTLDFNNIFNGLPNGVFVTSNASATSLGTSGSYTATRAAWSATGAGFKNFASATGLTASASVAEQDNSTNRALGVRQTGTADIGGDPGAAFVFVLENTTGKNNLAMEFRLQSLDASSGRITVWSVDYGLGDNPTLFTTVTPTGSMTTGGSSFTNNLVTVNFPTVLNNYSGKIFIRIVARTATTGSGSRASTAIDDVKFTWN